MNLVQKINIMLISDKLFFGGAEMVVYNLATNLNKARFQVHICCLESLGEIGERIKAQGIEVFNLKSKKGMDFSLPFKLARLLKTKKIDIIHAHNSTAFKHAVMAAQIAKTPIIIQTRHGNELSGLGLLRRLEDTSGLLAMTENAMMALRKKLHRLIYRFLVNKADKIVCICNDLKEKIARDERIKEEKLFVIFNGIKTDCFGAAAPRNDGTSTDAPRNDAREDTPCNDDALLQELGLNKDDLILINVANIRPEKGQVYLIDAFKELVQTFPNLKLLIAGKDSDIKLAQTLKAKVVENKMEDKVLFLGQRSDINELLAISDIFVLPSLTEGMPVTILEAMAMQKPILATNVGGIPEMIQNGSNGILIESKNTNALISALSGMITNNDMRRCLGQKAKETAQDQFRLEIMIRNYEELYKNLYLKKSKSMCLVAPFPPPIGGMSIQADILFNSLIKEGITVKAINTAPRLRGVLNMPGIRTLIKPVRMVFKSLYALRSCKTVIIFSCSYAHFFLTTIPALVIGRLYRKRILISYHGGLCESFFKQYKAIIKPFFKMADTVLVPSQYLKEVLAKFGVHTEVLPNIIDLDKFTFKSRERLLPNIVITRHHNHDYNVECALAAFSIVKKDMPLASLTLIGSGNQTNRLKELVRQSRIADVNFKGSISNEEIPGIFERNDIFLNTSLADNQPVSFLEAFSAGLMVVSTPAGGIPYLVKDGENGLLTKTFEPKDVAARIKDALNGKYDTIDIIRNAKKTAAQHSWPEVKKRLFALLEI